MFKTLPSRSNPDYGHGAFRRRLLYRSKGNERRLDLYDDYHDMSLFLTVGNGAVSSIEAVMRRYPKTTCPGAVAGLQRLVGVAIADGAETAWRLPAPSQCTHLRDLAAFSMTSWVNDIDFFRAEITVTDRDREQRQDVSVSMNGEVRLACRVGGDVIISPDKHAGRPILGGFRKWVFDSFDAQEADLWLMAQISILSSWGRQWIVDGEKRTMVGEEPEREGACYSFSTPAYPDAMSMIGYARDHSDKLPPVPDRPFADHSH